MTARRFCVLLASLQLLHRAATNPFRGVDFLLPERYTQRVASSAAIAGEQIGSKLAEAAKIPTAVWLDKIDALPLLTQSLEQARRQSRLTGKQTVVVIVVYNLPGRDCSAKSSAGELKVGELDRYQNEYLLPISLLAAEFEDVRKVSSS